ncbi:Cytochrome P450 [Mycena indigotica]|uniref:Cytochrome P450 n=1 Tax=Mycena indigotica TaxID=2126181 RepID=A0A8H6WES4_9AGAR|nr:Cytochrome P450 [Mycena indigotica]KAF7316004.1 Cytochrome P450 [Mycena indigotica]
MDAVVDRLMNGAISGNDMENEQPGSALATLLSTKELSDEQIRVHAKSLLLLGFATTASGIKVCVGLEMIHYVELIQPLQWALVELAMRPQAQDRLRKELMTFATTDPSYEDLTSLALPYLDAVVREALRLHPILGDSPRIALEDDILPLASPIRTASGDLIDSLPIRKGTSVTVSLYYTNKAKSIWGNDAAEFKPERWLDGGHIPDTATQYPGFHHTMVFSDGPRACLGKGFALAEIKIVLSLLVRKFIFSPRDGKHTQYEKAMFGPHPKVAGEPGGRLPIRVTRVEA